MRITFVLPFASLAGGVRVIATYARCLTDLGHQVTVVSQPAVQASLRVRLSRFLRGKAAPKAPRPTPLLEFLGERHVILDRRRPITPADLPDADAVIATWWQTAEMVAALPPAKGRGFYLLQDYETFGPLPEARVAASFRLPLRKLAVSGYIRDEIQRRHGVEDIALLPNATDLDQFDAPPRERSQPLTVGFVYTTVPRKRVDLAVAAVKAARARIPDLRVLAFGARAPGADLPLPDWIEYHRSPAQDAIPGLYARCDAWLFTSAHEGFGLPILEAMACRTPVLATRAGAAPDLIDGLNGTLLPPEADAFADAIVDIAAHDAAEWRRRSDAAHETAHRYSWAEATALLLTYLEDTAGPNP